MTSLSDIEAAAGAAPSSGHDLDLPLDVHIVLVFVVLFFPFIFVVVIPRAGVQFNRFLPAATQVYTLVVSRQTNSLFGQQLIHLFHMTNVTTCDKCDLI